jgi:hypothetical protein
VDSHRLADNETILDKAADVVPYNMWLTFIVIGCVHIYAVSCLRVFNFSFFVCSVYYVACFQCFGVLMCVLSCVCESLASVEGLFFIIFFIIYFETYWS